MATVDGAAMSFGEVDGPYEVEHDGDRFLDLDGHGAGESN